MDSKATLSDYRMPDTTNLRPCLPDFGELSFSLSVQPNSRTAGRFENFRKSSFDSYRIVNCTLLFTFIFTFIFLNCSNAQDEQLNIQPPTPNVIQQSSWTGAYLDVAGGNIIDGVEVFSQLGKCKFEDVVFLKLINHNDYDVKVVLLGGVYTKDRQWAKDPEGRKSITIKANKEVIGDCSSLSGLPGDAMTGDLMTDDNKGLLIKLKDYIDRTDNFNRYAPSLFEVTLER